MAGFPGGSAAEWIWTTDTLNDNEVFFRYTIGGTVPTVADRAVATLEFGAAKLRSTISTLPSNAAFPRSTSVGTWTTVSASDWTWGFFPALLWQMYDYTGDSDFLTAATSWSTSFPESGDPHRYP